jgi:hypothetical protein
LDHAYTAADAHATTDIDSYGHAGACARRNTDCHHHTDTCARSYANPYTWSGFGEFDPARHPAWGWASYTSAR